MTEDYGWEDSGGDEEVCLKNRFRFSSYDSPS